jgi:hypothetical protein
MRLGQFRNRSSRRAKEKRPPISVELRKEPGEQTEVTLARLQGLLNTLSDDYRNRSEEYYAAVAARRSQPRLARPRFGATS